MSVYGKNTLTSKWRPCHPEKYCGDVNTIVARSSWEVKFLNWCDNNPDIVAYASEEIQIPYFDPASNKTRRYFVDFWIKIKTATGIKKFLIEIKPDKFTKPPVQPKKKTKRYVEEVMQWLTNNAKWEAARKACVNSTDTEFIILTEHHLGIKS